MSEVKTGPVEVKEGDTCSECWRPAAFGFRSIYGDVNYSCEGHKEIHELYGQRDWLEGERDYTVGDWLKQVQAVDENVWQGDKGLRNLVILKSSVSDEVDVPYKVQHEFVLQSLEAAVDRACKLTQEKIDRKASELRNVTKEMHEAAWDAGSDEAELGR